MPSPFPGMDPYLEARGSWLGLHTALVVNICTDLQPQLVPDFVARPEQRVLLGPLDQGIRPDVTVRETEPRGGVALAVRQAPVGAVVPEEIEVPELTIPHRFVAIRTAQGHDIVSIIEVLSPWNKTVEGQREYLPKQTEVLQSQVNLVEIDLLRRGLHTVAVPENLAEPSDYRICIHRARQPRFELIRLGVRDPLPNIAIPIRWDHDDVILHLGQVFDRSYDGGAYGYDTDYSVDPDPPLSPMDAAWARDLLRPRAE